VNVSYGSGPAGHPGDRKAENRSLTARPTSSRVRRLNRTGFRGGLLA